MTHTCECASSLDATAAEQPAQQRSTARKVTSEEIFQGEREVRIRHVGEEYRLRITRQGKLILTK